MAIKLRVISDQHRELGERRTRVFGVNGGSIGRAPDNDWILPDAKRVVSGHHCEIEYRNGSYWVKDISTNGVFINDAEEPASQAGPVQLTDGDRLRLGDYEIVVSVDKRTDFLPSPGEESSAAKSLDSGINAKLDVNNLFRSRDDTDPGSIPVKNAFGMKPSTVRQLTEETGEEEIPAPPGTPPDGDWAMKTRPVTKQELADALSRRKNRTDARERSAPYHQQASTWTDLRSALQAFCRGAGIEIGSLTPEAQSMLPLLAGQLLREAVVGLIDLQHARGKDTPGTPTPTGSNPLRTSQSVEQALQRLFESYGRLAGGPVDSMREVFVEIRDHDAASAVHELLGQLAPANVADQFERGRSRALAPGQDPRPKYWEHYLEFYRVLTQGGADGLPHQFTEIFQRAYSKAREELRNRRRGE
jgi:type VI secretion system protein